VNSLSLVGTVKVLASALSAIKFIVENGDDIKGPIMKIIEIVKVGSTETMDPKKALAEIDKLMAQLRANDKLAKAAMGAKFGPGN
jgi:hypothetical protein